MESANTNLRARRASAFEEIFRPPPAPPSPAINVVHESNCSELDEGDLWVLEDGLNKLDVGSSVDARPPKHALIRSSVAGRFQASRVRGDGLNIWDPAPKGLLGISALRGTDTNIGSQRIPEASKMISRIAARHEVNAALIIQHIGDTRNRLDDCAKQMVAQSAPLHIPDWSRYRDMSREKLGNIDNSSVQETDEDDDGNRLPPHEILAREYARSGITSFSMCEGAGRTLKGRDLSRVRNDVLSRTGFID